MFAHIIKYSFKTWFLRGTWLAQLVKRPTLVLRLRSWSQGHGLEPYVGLHAGHGVYLEKKKSLKHDLKKIKSMTFKKWYVVWMQRFIWSPAIGQLGCFLNFFLPSFLLPFSPSSFANIKSAVTNVSLLNLCMNIFVINFCT